jgi:hypothetical protein
MQTITSFPASSIPRDQLGSILADYLALDRARILRRLLVTRFGLLALLAAVLGTVVHGFFPFARWLTIGLLLLPPAWALMAELRLERRLSRRLDGVDATVTHKFVPPSRIRGITS